MCYSFVYLYYTIQKTQNQYTFSKFFKFNDNFAKIFDKCAIYVGLYYINFLRWVAKLCHISKNRHKLEQYLKSICILYFYMIYSNKSISRGVIYDKDFIKRIGAEL